MLAVIGVMALLVLGLAAVPVVLAIISAARRRRGIRLAPQLKAEARIIDKPTQTIGGGPTATDQRSFVTFQLPDGSRLDLVVPASEAGQLVVSDEGRVGWQGSRYLGFTRQILRWAVRHNARFDSGMPSIGAVPLGLRP